MGYYTDYYLNVKNVQTKEKFDRLVETFKQKQILNYALYDGQFDERTKRAEFSSYDSVKWYDHEKDMIYIASLFPEMYFELEGHGEEFGDFWRDYYHDKEWESCRGDIIYEEPMKIPWNRI